MDALLQDLRTAARRVSKTPLFAAIVIATLALGIGASTSLFSVVHAVLLRPLPYPDADRLMMVWAATGAAPQSAASYPEYEDWRRDAQGFDALAAYRGQTVNFTGRGEPGRFVGAFVSSNLLDMLGARIQLGRGFAAEETDPATAKPVALLSNAVFHERFGADPAVVGSTLNLNGQPFTVVGVVGENMDPGRAPFDGWFMGTEVWLPIAYFPNAKGLERGQSEILVVGRLSPGVTPAVAQANVNLVAARLEKEFPEAQAGRRARVRPLVEQIVGDTRPALLMSLAAALGVLIICCVNVANLLAGADGGAGKGVRDAHGPGSRRRPLDPPAAHRRASLRRARCAPAGCFLPTPAGRGSFPSSRFPPAFRPASAWTPRCSAFASWSHCSPVFS